MIQFIQFCIVGALGTGVHFLVLMSLVETDMLTPVMASGVAFIVATIFNFGLNKMWTFGAQIGQREGQFLRYLFVAGIGLVINIIAIWGIMTYLGLHYLLAQIGAIAIVVLWNFWGSKQLVFADRRLPARNFELDRKDFKYDLSVIIPAYNEASRIKKTLRSIRKYAQKSHMDIEVIVVDDCSSDATSRVVPAFQDFPHLKLVTQEKNTGKGGAIRRGFYEAEGMYTLFMDADNSTDIAEFEKLKPSLKKTPVVIGSRYVSSANQEKSQNIARKILSRGGNKLIRNLLRVSLLDTQCGFKAFHTPVSKFLAKRQRIERFAFDMELLAIAGLHRIPVKEIGVEWINDEDTKVKFFRDSYRSLRDLAKIKLNLWTGKYN